MIDCKHKSSDLAIIEARDGQAEGCPRKAHALWRVLPNEVRLDADRETDGDGQGSGLSGEAESQFAGLRFARLAASQ